MGVHPAACCGIGSGMADGKAVLDDVFPGMDGAYCQFVPLGDILQGGDGQAVYLHQGALGNGVQCDHYIVDGADMNSLRHNRLLFVRSKWTAAYRQLL